ncbi:MAG: hypothetical protein MRY74_07810 [Neomegalonema sp.]|nr:hypothetical protein [Neomegalonema sp.]
MATHRRAAGAALAVSEQDEPSCFSAATVFDVGRAPPHPDAAFNPAHWGAVDLVADAFIGARAFCILVSAPGLGAAAVVAAAEAQIAAEHAGGAGGAEGSARQAFASSGLADVAAVLAQACGLDPALDDVELIAALRQPAAAPWKILLALPAEEPVPAQTLRFLEQLTAPRRGRRDQPPRIVLVGDTVALAPLIADADRPLGDPDCRAHLRPHGPDEVRSYLRSAARASDAMGATPSLAISGDAAWGVYQSTGGSPVLLARIGAALKTVAQAPDPVSVAVAEAQRDAAEDWAFLRDSAFVSADASDMPNCDAAPNMELGVDLVVADPVADDGAPSPCAAATSGAVPDPAPIAPPAAPKRPGGSSDLRNRLQRLAARRRRIGAFVATAILTVCGAATMSGVLFKERPPADSIAPIGSLGRETALDMADSALAAAGSAVHALSASDFGALGKAMQALGDKADDIRRDLVRGRTALAAKKETAATKAAPSEAAIIRALALAERRSAAGRFIGPLGGSAYEALLEVDRIRADDPRLLAAFKSLEKRYVRAARAALKDADFERFYRANNIIERIRARRPIRDIRVWQ